MVIGWKNQYTKIDFVDLKIIFTFEALILAVNDGGKDSIWRAGHRGGNLRLGMGGLAKFLTRCEFG